MWEKGRLERLSRMERIRGWSCEGVRGGRVGGTRERADERRSSEGAKRSFYFAKG